MQAITLYNQVSHHDIKTVNLENVAWALTAHMQSFLSEWHAAPTCRAEVNIMVVSSNASQKECGLGRRSQYGMAWCMSYT